MSDDDWETNDQELPSTTASVPNNWDDEDADEDAGELKDAWDESDDEKPKQEEDKPAAKASPKPKKKKTLAQKIAERDEEEERKRKERIAKVKELEDPEESAEARKARLAKSVMEADLENAKALFGDLALSGGIPQAEGAIEALDPSSRADFDGFVKVLMKKLSTFESKPQYAYFVETLLRDLVVSLSPDAIRQILSSLTAVMNEKQKALKEAQSKGKKKSAKKSLKAGPGNDDLDITNYDDTYDDFDDFM